MQYEYFSTQRTATLGKGPGAFLGLVTVNTAVSSAVITIYDSLAGSGNVIAVVDGNVKGTTAYFARCRVGLTVKTTGANPDCSVIYD